MSIDDYRSYDDPDFARKPVVSQADPTDKKTLPKQTASERFRIEAEMNLKRLQKHNRAIYKFKVRTIPKIMFVCLIAIGMISTTIWLWNKQVDRQCYSSSFEDPHFWCRVGNTEEIAYWNSVYYILWNVFLTVGILIGISKLVTWIIIANK